MKVLVTGAAGFIGSYFSGLLLEKGVEVTGIDNFSSYYDVGLKKKRIATLEDKGMKFLFLDLAAEGWQHPLPNDFEYIFHFAAQPGISAAVPFEDYLRNNVEATRQLISFASLQHQLKLFVNISTSSVYGLHATKDEEAVPEPASWYGVTKLAAEQLVLSEARMGNFKACSLRLYSVYGPGERPDKLYTKLIGCIRNEEPFALFDGSLQHERSFTYVGDICDGIQSVIGKEEVCDLQLINLGSGMQHTTAEGINIVEEILGRKALIKNMPARSGDQQSTRAIITKAESLLGYKPSTSLQQGLQQQVDWQKAHD